MGLKTGLRARSRNFLMESFQFSERRDAKRSFLRETEAFQAIQPNEAAESADFSERQLAIRKALIPVVEMPAVQDPERCSRNKGKASNALGITDEFSDGVFRRSFGGIGEKIDPQGRFEGGAADHDPDADLFGQINKKIDENAVGLRNAGARPRLRIVLDGRRAAKRYADLSHKPDEREKVLLLEKPAGHFSAAMGAGDAEGSVGRVSCGADDVRNT